MRSRWFIWSTSLFLSVAVLSACALGATPEPPSSLNITVSIVPQGYFVERIGGEWVQVNVIVGQGGEPHTYEPKPEQLKALSVSQAYFAIGVDFEDAWLGRIADANPNMRIVDTTLGIDRMPMAAASQHGADQHEQGDGEQEHDASTVEHPDPHIWLSPSLVKTQARTIYTTLAELDPSHEDDYAANLESFLADIDELDRSIRDTLEGVPARKFMVFHPAWGYFARDYALEMIPVEVGGQEPSAAEMANLIEVATTENIKVVFAQPEMSTRAADTIAKEIGGKVVLVSPLAPDWLENLNRVADAFAEALSG
jgi:zinc transport system substrate-binding protein